MYSSAVNMYSYVSDRTCRRERLRIQLDPKVRTWGLGRKKDSGTSLYKQRRGFQGHQRFLAPFTLRFRAISAALTLTACFPHSCMNIKLWGGAK